MKVQKVVETASDHVLGEGLELKYAVLSKWGTVVDVLCKLNIQATGMSKGSSFQPRLRASNSKWKTGCECRTEEQICGSCMRVYTLFMMGVTFQRIPASACSGAISWDPSRYCGVTHIQNKSLQKCSESFTGDQTTGRGERIFLALWKKARAAQTGTRDVGDTIVVSTTVGTIKSHRVHISSTQRRSSSAVAQTEINAQSSEYRHTWTRRQDGDFYQKVQNNITMHFIGFHREFFVKCIE